MGGFQYVSNQLVHLVYFLTLIILTFFAQTSMSVLHHRVQMVVHVLIKSIPINAYVYLDTLEKTAKLVS